MAFKILGRSGKDLVSAGSTADNLSAEARRITNVAAPVAATDAATREFVLDEIANSSSAGALDGTFRIRNTADETKQLAFDVSGVAAAATRTIIMPNANVDLGLVATAVQNDQLGAANGVATLNALGKLTASQVPAIAITETYVVADIAARDALVIGPADGEVQTGDVAVVTDATADPQVAAGGASYIYTGAAWQRLITPTDVVQSVNGQTGVVVLDTDDIAEGATNFYYTSARFDASLATKDTDDLAEGATNLYFTEARVLSTVLTGLAAGTNAPIAATDTVLQAFAKLQAQITGFDVSGKANTNLDNLVGPTAIPSGVNLIANSTLVGFGTSYSVQTQDQTTSNSGDARFTSGSVEGAFVSGVTRIRTGESTLADRGTPGSPAQATGNLLATSGSVAGTRGNSGLVQITSGTVNTGVEGNSGSVNIFSGGNNGTGNTGNLLAASGTVGGTGAGNSGTATYGSGFNNAATGTTGAVVVSSGLITNAANGGNSGNTSVFTGNVAGSGNSGDVIVATGSSGSGQRGIVSIDGRHVSVNSKQIKDLADPTLDQDAATKKYVDDLVEPLNTAVADLQADSGRAFENGTMGEAFGANEVWLVRRAKNGETAGRYYKAQADSAENSRVVGFVMVGADALIAGNVVKVYKLGEAALGSSDTPFAGTAGNSVVYLSQTTAGKFTLAPSETAGQWLKEVGFVANTGIIEFQPGLLVQA